MGYSVAIDGPAGAGKSTIAKQIAKQMNFIYVDTGAMYRAMALFLIRNNVSADDKEKIEEICKEAKITIEYRDGEQVVLLDGENVNGLIRTEEVGNMASASSVNGEVRKKLVALQQELAKTTDVIMDGRDIGTVVFPDAELKIFVTASAEIRAQRRYDELKAKGQDASYEDILNNVKERDYIDQNRAVSPLRQAEDAILLDNSQLTIEEQKRWLAEQFQRVVHG